MENTIKIMILDNPTIVEQALANRVLCAMSEENSLATNIIISCKPYLYLSYPLVIPENEFTECSIHDN